MKNFFKQISKTFIVAIMILVTTVTFVGCGKNKSKTASINASEITDTNNGDNKADNVSDDKDSKNNPSEDEQKIELSGIYKYTRELTFDDCDRSNEAEVIEYFKTRDFNGVYDAVKPLGFDNFISNHTESAESMFYFNGNNASIILATNGNYTLVPGSEFLANETFIKIEDNNDGTYTLYIAFITNTDVTTPLVVKIPITKVANSENILTDNIFKFVNGSAHIDYDLTNKPTTEATIASLANIFNLEVSENTLQEIENLLSEKVFGFNEDLTRASLLKLTEENTIGGSSFTMVNSSNEFSLNGITYKVTAHSFTLAENVEVIELSINILDNTNLVFKISK